MRCKIGRSASMDEMLPPGVRAGDYSCCFCCHVRMGTVFLGVFSLIKDLLVVTIITALTLHPELAGRSQAGGGVISSYFSSIDEESGASQGGVTNRTTSVAPPPAMEGGGAWGGNRTGTVWGWDNVWDCDDKVLGLLLTLGSSLLSIALLYGVINARPKYVLPYFWLQMFDFCITGLTVIGYFSYGPDVRRWIETQRTFPYREELLALGREWLVVLAAVIAVTVLWTKAYCIGVVWSCYKYLVYRVNAPLLLALQAAAGEAGGASLNHPDGGEDGLGRGLTDAQMVLPPKYEDLPEIQFGADPLTSLAPPPPPYDLLDQQRADGGAAATTTPLIVR